MGYAIRRSPEPFDFLDRWEVVELNFYRSTHHCRSISHHISKRGALKRLRTIEALRENPHTTTSADTPLDDLRAKSAKKA